MKKTASCLISLALLSSSITPLWAENSPLQGKVGIFSLSENIYTQPFLVTKAYKELTSKQKKAKKIAHYEGQNLKPLRNRLLAWTAGSIAWFVVFCAVFKTAHQSGFIEDISDKIKDFPNPSPYSREVKRLEKALENKETQLKSKKEELKIQSAQYNRGSPMSDFDLSYYPPLIPLRNECDQLSCALDDTKWKAREEMIKLFGYVVVGGVIIAALSPIVFYSAKLLKNTFDSWANRFWGRKIHPIEPLERKYVVKKEYLPSKLQDSLEKAFVLARFDHTRLQEAQQLSDVILGLPMKKFRIHYTEKELELLLKGYPKELQAKMNAFAFRQMMMQSPDTVKPSLTTIRKGKRNAAYFEGAPGTGKTRFAQLTAQALNLPFAPISLEGASISDLVGRPMTSDDPTPGLILQALTNATVNGKTGKNAILFLDEADRVINNSKSEVLPFLLKLLDPETKTFFNPYLGVPIDISNLIIVLAGNYSIADEALAKRLQIIQFNGFPTEYKMQVIWESTLNRMLDSYNQNGRYLINFDDFTEEDKAEINQLIALDQDPGFRTIEAILMDYIDYKGMQKHNFQLIERPDFEEKIRQASLKYKKS